MAKNVDKNKKIKQKDDTAELRRARIDHAKEKMATVKEKVDKKSGKKS
jgi:hypothetical protein